MRRSQGLLSLKAESTFTIRAYQRAACTIEHLPTELSLLVKEESDLRQIPGIGEAISAKITEPRDHRSAWSTWKSSSQSSPEGILALMDVPGIGPKTALRITTELGVSNVEELEQAIVEGRMSAMPRLGAKTADNILRHIRSERTKDRRIPHRPCHERRGPGHLQRCARCARACVASTRRAV